MQPLVLTDDLLTGIKDIDQQHRGLFALGNIMLGEGDETVDALVFRRALAFLVGYVEYHFAAEEFGMKLFGFPGLDRHRALHDQFRATIHQISGRAKMEGPSSELKLLLHFQLSDWLTYHIKQMDRAFAEFLQKGGGDAFALPTPQELRRSGVQLMDAEDVQVIPFDGEITPAELRARLKLHS